MSFFVYLLVSTNGNTYVGATVDLNRRLRQHNKEIKGGAHATGVKVAQGETWTRAAHVSGFPERPTSKAIAYTEWSAPPVVHLETDESKSYENLFPNNISEFSN